MLLDLIFPRATQGKHTVISVLSVRLTFYSDYRTAMIIYALVTEVYPAD